MPIRLQSLHLPGRVLWSSGYERRLLFWRPWVQIPSTFFTICLKICSVCLENTEKNEKEPGDTPLPKKSTASKCFLGLFSRLNAVRNFVVAAGCSYKVNVGRRIDPKTLWTIYLFVWIIESANMDSKRFLV